MISRSLLSPCRPLASFFAIGLGVVALGVAGCPAASGPSSAGGIKTTCSAASLALGDETPVAVFDGKTLTYKDLGPEVKKAEEKALRQYCDAVAGVRRIALENHVTETLVGVEAKKAGKTNEEWVRGEVEKRVPEPTEADVQAFYDKQKAAMGDQLPPLEMVKPQVVGFLKREKSEAAVEEVISGLVKTATVVKKLPDVRSPPIDLSASKTTAVKGKAGAKVKVVEFADFQCPYCTKAADIVKELSTKYGDRVEFQYRHFPLRQMHPQAQRASEIAQCSGEQGKFWEVHDALYANQSALDEENAKRLAKEAGVDETKLTECLAAGRGAAQVDEDFAKGELAGVEGTPSFFINGRSFTGNPTVAGLASAIEEELKL
ncbi:MAG: DsbA family protein [Deltaproteobacteria bacterium]|nr:DsbA family protein [Deltaproteobacteria bacterium]